MVIAGILLESLTQKESGLLKSMGLKIGRLSTDHGLPLDVSMKQLEKSTQYDLGKRLVILHGALSWLLEHKRKSGATEKAIARQRVSNRKAIESYAHTGEVGIY